MHNILKLCPFCGRTKFVRVRSYLNTHTFEIEEYAVVCDHRRGGCGSESGHYSSPEDAVKYWNMRCGKNEA